MNGARGHGVRAWVGILDRWARELSEGVRGGLIFGLVVLVGDLDLLTGGEVSFSIFYMLPVALSARYHRGRLPYVCAFFAGLIWLAVELLAQPGYSHGVIPAWNASVRIGVFLLTVEFVRLLTDRDERLETAVKRQTAALQQLISRRRILEREMAEATAREQARLAEELHDGVGQFLAGLSYQARTLMEDLQNEGSSHAGRASRLVEMLLLTARLLRRIDHLLVPPIAGQGGLNVALRRLAGDVEKFSGVQCSLEVPDEPIVIGAFQALTLFRIGQEALNNAIKHGDGKSVRLSLRHTDFGLSLKVTDEGRGIDPNGGPPTGSGLRIMRHRAELIGASLEVNSREGQGTTVECLLPWRGARQVDRDATS